MAAEVGLFTKYGVGVELHREVGWATIRVKIIYRELDAAHAPAGLVVGANFGLGSVQADCLTGLVLNLQGDAITLSEDLWKCGVRDGATLQQEIFKRRRALEFARGAFAKRLVRENEHETRTETSRTSADDNARFRRALRARSSRPHRILRLLRATAKPRTDRRNARAAEVCRSANPGAAHGHGRAVRLRPQAHREVPALPHFSSENANEPGVDKAEWAINRLLESGVIADPALIPRERAADWFRADIFHKALQLIQITNP